jgi:hypothetical protein
MASVFFVTGRVIPVEIAADRRASARRSGTAPRVIGNETK